MSQIDQSLGHVTGGLPGAWEVHLQAGALGGKYNTKVGKRRQD